MTTLVEIAELRYWEIICELKKEIQKLSEHDGFCHQDSDIIGPFNEKASEIKRLEKGILILCEDPNIVTIEDWYAKMNNRDKKSST